eukprot:g73873.t1
MLKNISKQKTNRQTERASSETETVRVSQFHRIIQDRTSNTVKLWPADAGLGQPRKVDNDAEQTQEHSNLRSEIMASIFRMEERGTRGESPYQELFKHLERQREEFQKPIWFRQDFKSATDVRGKVGQFWCVYEWFLKRLFEETKAVRPINLNGKDGPTPRNPLKLFRAEVRTSLPSLPLGEGKIRQRYFDLQLLWLHYHCFAYGARNCTDHGSAEETLGTRGVLSLSLRKDIRAELQRLRGLSRSRGSRHAMAMLALLDFIEHPFPGDCFSSSHDRPCP